MKSLTLLLICSTFAVANVDMPGINFIPSRGETSLTSYAKLAPFAKAGLYKNERIDVSAASPTGVPEFIVGEIGSVKSFDDLVNPGKVRVAIKDVIEVMGIGSLDLVFIDSVIDDVGNCHARYRLKFKNWDVDGTIILVHVKPTGEVYCVNGDIPDIRDFSELPLSPKADNDRVYDVCKRITSVDLDEMSEPELVLYRSSRDRKTRLSWKSRTKVGRARILYIDDETNLIADDLKYDRGVGTFYVGYQNSYAFTETRNYAASPTTVSYQVGSIASANSGDADVYPTSTAIANANGYLLNNVGFQYTGPGMQVIVKARQALAEIFTYGQPPVITPYVNKARYVKLASGTDLLLFGPGDGVSMSNLHRDRDVVVHEYAHAVFMNRLATPPSGEAIAILESLGDCLAKINANNGSLTSSTDWRFGTTCVIPNPSNPASAAIRFLADPAFDSHSRDYYPSLDTTSDESTKAYNNAGILNLAFKLSCTGGYHPRLVGKPEINVPAAYSGLPAYTFMKAAYYFLTPQSTMAQFRQAVIGQVADYPNPPGGKKGFFGEWCGI